MFSPLLHKVHQNNCHHTHDCRQTLSMYILDVLQNRLWKKHKHDLLYIYYIFKII